MADMGGFRNRCSGFGGGAMEDKDFGEDVWGVAANEDDSGPKTMRVSKDSSGSSSAWRILPAAPRKIPRANNTLVPSSDDAKVVQLQGSSSSAPMDIPDWSKIYGKKASTGGCGYGDHYHDNGEDDEYDDDDDDMVPPHEWIARKLARSQISSFSVCEGMGRTLKGRDLSKVRNAILTKTGFIE